MRLFLLSLLAFVSVSSFAQEKQKPSLWEKDYTRLKGTTIELTKSKYNTSINVFVSIDKRGFNAPGAKNKYYSSDKKKGVNYITKAKNFNIMGKRFNVEDVKIYPGTYGKMLLTITHPHYGKLYLSEGLIYPSSFEVVDNYTLPDLSETVCDEMGVDSDKFEGTKTIFDVSEFPSRISPIVVIQKGGVKKKYIRFRLTGASIGNTGESGLKILFSDGVIMDYPGADTDVKVDSSKYNDYVLISSIILDDKLLNKMKSVHITDIKLGTLDGGLSKKATEIFLTQLDCMLNGTYGLRRDKILAKYRN